MSEYTEDQHSQLRDFFNSYDSDNNGLLEFVEFAHLVEALGEGAVGPRLSPEETRIAFDKADANGNGVINFEEFLIWLGEQ